jgi:hypothetical protein
LAGVIVNRVERTVEHRAGVASSFFVVMYVGISVPVIGEGLLTQATGLRSSSGVDA